jgi:hypothetical protein
MSKSFAQAEAEYLEKKAQSGGAKRPRKPVKTARAIAMVSAMSTVEYFKEILSDKQEAQLWRMFITGLAPRIGEDGIPVFVDGKLQYDPIELNAISWAAFKRAVEYKRGQPVVKVEEPKGKDNLKVVKIITIGIPPKIEEKSKVAGMLPGA